MFIAATDKTTRIPLGVPCQSGPVDSGRALTERTLMKKAFNFLLAISVLTISSVVSAQTSNKENEVRKAVQSFYDAFNTHGFGKAA
jgi:hypothetical protein